MKANFHILGITRKICEILRLVFFLLAIYEVAAPLIIIPYIMFRNKLDSKYNPYLNNKKCNTNCNTETLL